VDSLTLTTSSAGGWPPCSSKQCASTRRGTSFSLSVTRRCEWKPGALLQPSPQTSMRMQIETWRAVAAAAADVDADENQAANSSRSQPIRRRDGEAHLSTAECTATKNGGRHQLAMVSITMSVIVTLDTDSDDGPSDDEWPPTPMTRRAEKQSSKCTRRAVTCRLPGPGLVHELRRSCVGLRKRG
jgi:hypothetical protein